MLELSKEEQAITRAQAEALPFDFVLQRTLKAQDELVPAVEHGELPAVRATFQAEHEWLDAAGELLPAQTFPQAPWYRDSRALARFRKTIFRRGGFTLKKAVISTPSASAIL